MRNLNNRVSTFVEKYIFGPWTQSEIEFALSKFFKEVLNKEFLYLTEKQCIYCYLSRIPSKLYFKVEPAKLMKNEYRHSRYKTKTDYKKGKNSKILCEAAEIWKRLNGKNKSKI
jgi:hypothetical protein